MKKNKIDFPILIIVFIFGSLSFLLPNHYLPWLTAYQDFSIFLTFIFLALSLFDKNIFIDKKFIVIVCFSLIPLLQFVFNKIFFFGDALIAFIYILGFGLAFLIGLNLAKKNSIENILIFLSAVLIFISILSVYLILKQWLLLTNGGIWIADLPLNGRPFANFAQPNNCATFLSMGLMAILYLYEKKHINKFCGIVLFSFILFGIALTQSRTAWVFTLFFVIWWFWKTRYLQTRLHKFSIFYFLGIFILFVMILPYISNYLGVVATTDAISRATSGYLRIPMWHQMILAIQEQPLWGYGWNQVSVAQQIVFLEYPTTEQIDSSHNIILDLLIWNGIPIGVTIIGFLSWWLYHLSKLVISIENFIALAMVGGVIVHAMIEFPLDYAFFLLPVGFLLGLVQATENFLEYRCVSRTNILISFSLVGFLYIFIFIEYNVISKDIDSARFEALNIGNIYAMHDVPQVILLTQLREKIRFIRTEPKENMTQGQLDLMKKVAYRFASSENLYRYAQALALNHQPNLAKKYLLVIEKLYGKKYSFESLYYVNKSLSFKWQNKSGSNP